MKTASARVTSYAQILFGMALLASACGSPGTEAGSSSSPPPLTDDPSTGDQASLVGGSTSVGNMKGLVEIQFMDTGEICTGVLISRRSILTSARCLIPHMPANATIARNVTGMQIHVLGWDSTNNQYSKRCISEGGGAPECTTTAGGGKGIDLFVGQNPISATSAANDLGMIKFNQGQPYAWYSTDYSDYADLYTDAMPPGETRLQIYGFGNQGTRSAPGTLRTATEKVAQLFTSEIKLTADTSQTCQGDLGSPWTIRPSVPGSGNKVIGIQSIQGATDGTTRGCAKVNSTEVASRISADKIPWIARTNINAPGSDNPDPPCADLRDSAGRTFTRCYNLPTCSFGSAGGTYQGCLSSGCSACTADLGAYPKYFDHHANCSRNSSCGGSARQTCSINCPPPSDADR